MYAPIMAWLIIVALLGLSASIAIWSRLQKRSRARGLSVLAFMLAAPAAGGALAATLGYPVPLVHGLNLPAGDHTIIGAKIVIGEGIFVLVDRGADEPRYYRLPWDEKTASQLQEALDGRGEGGEAGMHVDPFEWSWDVHPPQFWAKPQPKVLPDKPAQEAAPHFDNSI